MYIQFPSVLINSHSAKQSNQYEYRWVCAWQLISVQFLRLLPAHRQHYWYLSVLSALSYMGVSIQSYTFFQYTTSMQPLKSKKQGSVTPKHSTASKQWQYRKLVVVRALNSKLHGYWLRVQFPPLRCPVTTLGKLFIPTCLCRFQWSNGSMPGWCVRGHGHLCLSWQPVR